MPRNPSNLAGPSDLFYCHRISTSCNMHTVGKPLHAPGNKVCNSTEELGCWAEPNWDAQSRKIWPFLKISVLWVNRDNPIGILASSVSHRKDWIMATARIEGNVVINIALCRRWQVRNPGPWSGTNQPSASPPPRLFSLRNSFQRYLQSLCWLLYTKLNCCLN